MKGKNGQLVGVVIGMALREAKINKKRYGNPALSRKWIILVDRFSLNLTVSREVTSQSSNIQLVRGRRVSGTLGFTIRLTVWLTNEGGSRFQPPACAVMRALFHLISLFLSLACARLFFLLCSTSFSLLLGRGRSTQANLICKRGDFSTQKEIFSCSPH